LGRAIIVAMDGRHVGRVLRSIREHLGRTQADVATEAAVSPGSVSRAERGMVGTLPVAVVERIAASLGASLYLDIRYQGGMADRLIDRVHAALVDHMVGALRSDWEVVVEYTFNHFGERGSVDVLAWHAATRTLLIVEVKSAFTDLQDMLASFGRKLRVLPDIVRRDRGWDPLAVGRLIVVSGTTSNRKIVADHRAIFEVSFPARAHAIRAWLAHPRGPIAGVWFVSADAVPTLRTQGRRRASQARARAGGGLEATLE
jgi:transcriptional regulator with XRE-family HTH domain